MNTLQRQEYDRWKMLVAFLEHIGVVAKEDLKTENTAPNKTLGLELLWLLRRWGEAQLALGGWIATQKVRKE